MIAFTRPPVLRLITCRPAPAPRTSHSRAMNSSTCAGERLKLSRSMSQRTGRAPSRAIVPAVAKKVKVEVITSSPGPMPSAMRARSSASVPEETPIPCSHPVYRARLSSSSRTCAPRMNCWLRHTRSMADWASAAIFAYCCVRSSSGTFMAGGGDWVVTGYLRAGQKGCSVARSKAQSRPGPFPWASGFLVAVVLAEPVDEAPHAHFDRRRGPIAHVPCQVLDIRKRFRHVAELQRQEVLLGLAPQALLDHLDVAHQLHRLVIANVVETKGRATRCRVGCAAVPRGRRLRQLLAGPRYPLRNVLHVREVPPMMSVVEYVDGLPFQDVAREEEERHVRTPPGTIHREEPQPRGGQLEERGIGMRHQLVGALRSGIDRQRMIRDPVRRERHVGVGAVDGAGRCVHQVLDPVVAAAFEDVQGARDIAVHVAVRILQRVTDPRLGGEMDDPIEFLAREEILHAGIIGQIQLHETEARL